MCSWCNESKPFCNNKSYRYWTSTINIPSLFKINLIDFSISFKLFVCAKKLVEIIKSNFEYLFNIFLANLKSSGFLIVLIPFLIDIFATSVGSIPNTFEYFFLASSKNEPSLLPISNILGLLFWESYFILSSIDPKLFIFSFELPLK